MKTPTASSATSSQREQTSLLSQMPRSPRSNVCSMPDPENPSASVHPKRFSTPSLTLKISMRWEVESALPNKRSLRLKTWDVEGPLYSCVGLSLAALGCTNWISPVVDTPEKCSRVGPTQRRVK